MRYGAHQVAEQVARSGLCGDHQMHLIEVHHQTEQVEVERPQRQVEDGATTGCANNRNRYLLCYRANDIVRRIEQRTGKRSDCDQLITLRYELRHCEVTDEASTA